MSSFPQASAQAQAWHFLAGPARLCISAGDIDAGGLPPCAAEAAVVLDLAGELLDALAATGLLGEAPWQWVAATGGLTAGGAQARWRGAEAQAHITLPWPVLRALDGPPDIPGLQWQPTAAECLLAQLSLSDADLAALEPGGLLLLDDTPRPHLVARSEALAQAEAPWQLVARWEQPLALEVVMGWRGPCPPVPVHCQLVEAARPDVVRAQGRLLPWGSGQALRIDSI